MKIGVYNELASDDIGGAECCVAVLAEALAERHEVEVVNHAPAVTRERLAQFTGTSLDGVRLRSVAPEHNPFKDAYNPWYGYPPGALVPSRNPWRRYRQARAWHADASRGYDLFINFTHWMPPFCHARRGVLAVLFPFFIQPRLWPWKESANGSRWRRLARTYYDWEWRRRLASYQVKTAISEFSRGWTRQWWGIDCRVIYPPVALRFGAVDKANVILSVGRFTAWETIKRQREMMEAFRRLKEGQLGDWTYYSVGGLSGRPEDVAYFEEVSRRARECDAHTLANAERARLKDLFERAKIFWHASGYGQDESAHPELAEHFGIATVEAMAAGCVPVVVNKGGQAEIVQHGVNGFVWDTLEELQEYTLRVARDEDLRRRMSEAARRRAETFSREEFVKRFTTILQPLQS